MGDKWYTIPQLVEITGIAETTLRRYIKTFKTFLPAKRYGRQTKYNQQAADTLKQIAELYEKKNNTEQIKSILEKNTTQYIDIYTQEQQQLQMVAAAEVFAKEIKLIMLQQEQRHKLELEEIKDAIVDRHNILIEQQDKVIKELQEQNQILRDLINKAPSTPAEQKGLFKKIFSK